MRKEKEEEGGREKEEGRGRKADSLPHIPSSSLYLL
jgi:hypothetical protein